MKTTKRLLALNLVLVLLLTLVPMAAFADEVNMTLGETVTFEKSDTSGNAEFTFTPDKDGAYKVEIKRPYPRMASPEFIMYFGNGDTDKTMDVREISEIDYYEGEYWNVNFTCDLEKGKTYSFSFENNSNGDYAATVTYIGATEKVVDINDENFPDANFRAVISDKYDINSDGFLSKVEIAAATTVDVGYIGYSDNDENNKIGSLEGIQYFTAMNQLYCMNNKLESLPQLPESLQSLYCYGNNFSTLSGLPTGLIYLDCSYNQLIKLPALPKGLEYLDCDSNKLESLPTLPDSLESLGCNNNKLTSLPETLPAGLEKLYCEYNELTVLPTLPESLRRLNCSNNLLTSIALNENTKYVYINVSDNSLPNYGAVTGQDIKWGQEGGSSWDDGTYVFGEQNHEHIAGTTIEIRPTCTNDGYTRTRCARCAHYEDSAPTPALGGRHVFELSRDGADKECLRCNRCGGIFDFSVTEGNCEAPGEKELKYKYTRVYDLDGNEFDTVVISGNGAMVDYESVLPPWNYGDNLQSFIVEEGVTKLGMQAARSWSSANLKYVQLPSTLETIGLKAFANNRGLQSITLPEGLETIGEGAFEGCNLLENITIPASVTEIGKQSFSPDINTILYNAVFAFSAYEVAEGNETYKSVDGILYSKDGKTLVNCPAGIADMNITVADGTKTLSNWAFYGNCNVQSITLPASIEKIDIAAFDYCNNLQMIYFNGTQEQWGEVGVYLADIKVICLGDDTVGEQLISEIGEIGETGNERVVIKAYDEGIISNDNNYAYFTKADDLTDDQLSNFVVIGQDEYQAYEIKLMTSEDNEPVQPESPVQVKLTVPEGYDSSRCKVYHVVDGNLILMNTTVKEEDGRTYLVFTTDSFSPFVVVQEHVHVYDDAIIEPTCTTQGYTEKTCTVPGCNHTIRDNFVGANGHKVVTDKEVAETCTETGLTEGKHCSVCNEVLVPQTETSTLPHEFEKGTCKNCGAADPDYTPPTPPTPPTPSHTHKYVTKVTAPTCTEMGYTTYTCACGKSSYIGNYVEALGHKFSGGKCEVCGAEDPDYVANPFKDLKETDRFYKEIIWAANEGIVKGDDKGNYNADATLTRAQVVTMLWRQAGEQKATKAADFTDLTQDWYKEAVAWAVENGITEGIGDGKFDPTGECTRAQFVTFLWRANNKPAATAAADFTDLTQGWYKDAVAWAVEKGVTNGVGDGKFAPDEGCTRGQAAAFLYRLANPAK